MTKAKAGPTPAQSGRIVTEIVKAGLGIVAVCSRADVPYESVKQWLRRGRGDSNDPKRPNTPALTKFAKDVEAAYDAYEGKVKDRLYEIASGAIPTTITTIKETVEGTFTTIKKGPPNTDPRSLQWMLEKTFPKKYGPKAGDSGGAEHPIIAAARQLAERKAALTGAPSPPVVPKKKAKRKKAKKK